MPNVQYDNAQLRSATPGEIDPANISISGGLFYQNSFMLDGFNMNNDLDPAGSQGSNPVAATALPGKSQGLNIDTSLLESITVQDSNVSAAYGGFTGGVVEASTKKATKKLGANVSYQITQGNAKPGKFSMTNYHIHKDSLENFLNSNTYSNQPEFIKHIFRSSLESKLNDKSGVVASFTTTQSFIPLNAYASRYMHTTRDENRKTQKRQSYNFFLKAHYDISQDLTIESQYAYMPQYNNYFIVNTKDSGFDFLVGGHQGGLKAHWNNELGFLSAQTNINYMDSSRINSAQHMQGWRVSAEKNWSNDINGTVSEGSYGNVDTKQLDIALKLMQDFKPIEIGIWKNTFNAGLEYSYTNAYYERLEDTFFFGSAFVQPLKKGESCLPGDWTCSASPVYYQTNAWKDNIGQYANRTTLYKAGKISLDNIRASAWVEDSMKFDFKYLGDVNTRIGVRADYDTLMKKTTLAPRFSLGYIFPWSKWDNGKNFTTALNFGANRYYGRNLFSFKLMEERSALQYTLNRANSSISWDNATSSQNKNDTNFTQLKVPYVDELMLGITQKVYMFAINAKYIMRLGKDEVRRACKNPITGEISALNCSSNVNTGAINTSILRYVYTNDGQSNSDVVSLSIQNDQTINTWEVKHSYILAADWTNVKRNYGSYADVLSGAEYANEWISYDGQLMRYIDKPANNFIRPYTIRFTTTHSFNIAKTKWLLNNFFRYRSGYNVMANVTRNADKDSFVIDGVLTKVDTFRKFFVPGSFSWDMRVGFEVDVYKKNILYMNFDIYNLLDRKNLAIASASYSSTAGTTAVPVYEVGRQFWLQVGYRY